MEDLKEIDQHVWGNENENLSVNSLKNNQDLGHLINLYNVLWL